MPSWAVPLRGMAKDRANPRGSDFLTCPYLLTISVTAVLPSELVAGAGWGLAEGWKPASRRPSVK